MRDTVPHKLNAPYAYLAQADANQYMLFVSILLDDHYQTQEEEVRYLNGLTQVTIRVLQKDEAPGGNVNRLFVLEPAGNTPESFFPDTDEIQISVEIYEDSNNLLEEFHLGLFYRDADNQPISAEETGAQKAFNCPYIYLEAESLSIEETGSRRDGIIYLPYLLVHLKGYDYQADRLTLTAPDNGVCDAIVILRQREDQEEITESYFAVNATQYYDSGRIEGNFTVTIVLEDNVAIADSLIHKDLSVLHKELWELEITPPLQEDNLAEPAPNLNETNGNGSQRSRRRGKVRNMSSRRRSSLLLDFRAPVPVTYG